MDGMKVWYQSKTIWGALIAIAASLLHVAGFEFAADAQGELADIAVTLAGVLGGLLSIYGRIVATTAVTDSETRPGGDAGSSGSSGK